MDYKKLYNEAKERFKAFKEKYYTRDTYFGDIIFDKTGEMKKEFESIFSELKESEDERIRKSIIRLIQVGGYMEPEDKTKALAYLEKQKEQKSLICDGEIEDKKRDIVAAIRKYYSTDYAEYLTSFLKGLSPEDNSEDEYGQEMLGIAYKLMYEHIPENLRTQEFWDSLKFMREYTGKVAIIHSCEKPTEWNKEDEGMLNCIIATLCEESHGGREANDKMVTWLENRLKSLRSQPKQEWDTHDKAIVNCIVCCLDGQFVPVAARKQSLEWFNKHRRDFLNRPSWKPSEEQMKALWDAYNGGKEQEPLRELIEQLKKLM